ncbi:MAG TPA: LamG domain-containing protein [Gemmataceae bacterium]|nr:LamG domain-containing protein [Gemmataceae bacterium]
MDKDLRDLLAAWLSEEEPSEERRVALLARLREDAAFRRAFIDEIRLLGMLKVVQSSEPRWLRLEDELGWSVEERATVDSLSHRVLEAARPRSRWRRSGQRWLAVAAAALVALSIYPFLRPGKTPETKGTVPVENPVELATAVKLDNVEWEPGEGLQPEVGGIVTAGRLHLRSGRLTLAFFSGVLLTMEGPADVELRTMDRVFCQQGKLRARVPLGAEGFTVLAPGYEVVDLGTEFGLNLTPGRPADLMVFKGEAALSVLGSNGHSVHSALVQHHKAVEVDPGAARIQEVAPQQARFVPVPELPPPNLELAPDYPAEVLAAKPWGYWRFEQWSSGRVPNELADRPSLRVLGGVRQDGTPEGNHWALFQADDPKQALLMDGSWSPPRGLGQGYALELWVQADSLGQNALVSLIDREHGADEHHVSLLELTARSQRSLFEPCAVRFLDRWPPSLSGGVNVFSRRSFMPALWHHVVGQKAGESLELYIDGRLVGSSPAAPNPPDPLAATTPCWLLVGRLKQRALPPQTGEIRPFEGRIDELAVYDRPLTVEEIRHHAGLRVEQ